MSDTPIQRKPPPKLDRALAAHERRARLIAQLHEQAIATASDLVAQRKGIRGDTAKDERHRKAEPGFARAPSCWRLSGSSLWAASSSPLFHGSDNPSLGLIGQRVNAAHSQRQSSVYRRNETPAAFDTRKLCRSFRPVAPLVH
jgi:hypothetical protein